MKRTASTVLALALTAAPALAGGGVPDGTYRCVADDTVIGDIRVSGETYEGPVADGVFTGAGETFVVIDGKIEWLGALPALDAMKVVVDQTTVRIGGFDLSLLFDGAFDFTPASCDLLP